MKRSIAQGAVAALTNPSNLEPGMKGMRAVPREIVERATDANAIYVIEADGDCLAPVIEDGADVVAERYGPLTGGEPVVNSAASRAPLRARSSRCFPAVFGHSPISHRQ